MVNYQKKYYLSIFDIFGGEFDQEIDNYETRLID